MIDSFFFFFLSLSLNFLSSAVFFKGATFAVPKATGEASAADCVGERKAAETEGARGEPGGKAQENPCHEGPGGLQQGHQWKPVYVKPFLFLIALIRYVLIRL